MDVNMSETDQMKEDFMEKLNTGELCCPTDLVYLLALHSWAFYLSVSQKDDAMMLLLEATSSGSAFVLAVGEALQLYPDSEDIQSLKCNTRHSIYDACKGIIGFLFNIFVKNTVTEKHQQQGPWRQKETSCRWHRRQINQESIEMQSSQR